MVCEPRSPNAPVPACVRSKRQLKGTSGFARKSWSNVPRNSGYFAEVARLNELLRKCLGWIFEVVESDNTYDTGIFYCLRRYGQHRLKLLPVVFHSRYACPPGLRQSPFRHAGHWELLYLQYLHGGLRRSPANLSSNGESQTLLPTFPGLSHSAPSPVASAHTAP